MYGSNFLRMVSIIEVVLGAMTAISAVVSFKRSILTGIIAIIVGLYTVHCGLVGVKAWNRPELSNKLTKIGFSLIGVTVLGNVIMILKTDTPVAITSGIFFPVLYTIAARRLRRFPPSDHWQNPNGRYYNDPRSNYPPNDRPRDDRYRPYDNPRRDDYPPYDRPEDDNYRPYDRPKSDDYPQYDRPENDEYRSYDNPRGYDYPPYDRPEDDNYRPYDRPKSDDYPPYDRPEDDAYQPYDRPKDDHPSRDQNRYREDKRWDKSDYPQDSYEETDESEEDN